MAQNKDIDNKIQEVVSGLSTTQATMARLIATPLSKTEAAAASTTAVHAAITLTTEVQTVTTSITNPPYARNITITCAKGGVSNMSGDVTITGTDIWGQTITDTIAEGADGTVQGVKAFKTVTSIALPARTNAGDTVSIGYGDLIGLDLYLPSKDCVIQCSLDGVIETTAATVVADDDEISKNTVDLNSALNGKVVTILYFVY